MSKPFFEFFCPVKVIAGHAALEHMAFDLGTLAARRPLLVTDAGVRRAGLLAIVETALRTGGVEPGAVFDDVPPDSSLHTVRKVAAAYRESGCDAIVAVGGG